jgi:hypothetical protein
VVPPPAAALAWLRARHPPLGRRLAAAAVLLALADLGARGLRLNPTAPRALYARPPVVDVLRGQGVQRVFSYTYTFAGGPRRLQHARVPALAEVPAGWSWPAAAALSQQMSLAPATPGRWSVASGFETDPVGLHAAGLAELEQLRGLLEGTPLQLRLLRMGGISHVLSFDAMPELTPVASLPVLLESPLRVYAVPGTLPLAYTVGASRTAAHAGVLLQPSFDAGQEVALDPGEPVLDAPPGPAGQVAVASRRADAITLDAQMAREGYLVLVETYDPGWRVRVDGRPQPLLRANTAFRAVRLAPGHHVVEMVYRPPAVILGASLTAASLLLAAVALAWRTGPWGVWGAKPRSGPKRSA